MKRVFYTYIVFILTILIISSCERERFSYDSTNKDDNELAEGQINLTSLKVAVEAEAEGVVTRNSINTSNFIIRIYNQDNGNKLVKEWVLKDMPEIFNLKVGNYSVSAYSHDELPAEFENPFFFGSQSFKIVADDITNIEVIRCFLKSIKVTVEYADNLKELLGPDVAVNITVGNGSLIYSKDETRAGYFQATSDASNLLNTHMTGTIEDANVSIEKGFSGVKAGEHRIIRYSLKEVDEGNNGNSGSAGVSISIDVTIENVDVDVTVDPGTEEGVPDFPGEGGGDGGGEVTPDMPVIVGDGFDIKNQTIDVSEASFANPMVIKVNINASKGIANLHVTIISTTLTPSELAGVGLSDQFDLANPGELRESLSGLGFPVGEQVVGQTSVLFDITNFTPLIPALGAGSHQFVIRVVDLEGNETTEILKLKS